jgi:hypothetical protein
MIEIHEVILPTNQFNLQIHTGGDRILIDIVAAREGGDGATIFKRIVVNQPDEINRLREELIESNQIIRQVQGIVGCGDDHDE